MPPSFFPDPLPPFNINNTVGAFEIGTLVAVFLFGATCLQVYLYFRKVTVVWLLELGHTIAVCHAVYTMSITWYGQPELLAVPPASLDASILLNGLIGPLEQAWFIRRLYALSKNIWLTAICCILSFARCLGSIAFASLALQRPNIIVFDFEYWWLLTCIVVLGSVNDLLLAGLLSWYLNKSKKTSIQAMSRLFDRLILWTIETSAITSFATVGMMIAFFIMPTTFIYVAVYLCLAKLYANALMAS
ncbi:hypothetical protein BT96DRAFT_995945 [Gymnopus androsaceus JB14]|uniref:DUF6534 domain-containing protein n=1 Tax=Gymnopus androsaceus JB14 TaxID=1447944 RepID=A0A6A4HI79_9AGAR|nr:hypothetical protein BT96DRAFT_995945 [Gymnopus androsaceus JB14]